MGCDLGWLLGNSAFGDDDHDRGFELGRILLRLGAEMQDHGLHECRVRDANGNTVGEARLDEHDGPE